MTGSKNQFSQRLRDAMLQAGFEPRPSVLVNMFNLEHRGASVTFQTASRWLKGVSLPDAGKINTLARVLGQRPETLLFGAGQPSMEVPSPRVPMGRQERALLDQYVQLDAEDRRLVRQLVERLRRAG